MSTFNDKLGNLEMKKGKLDGIPIVLWDAIPQCNEEACPIRERCPYQKTGKCTVRLKYLENVFNTVSAIPEHMDPVTAMKIGMHIIPLYTQLCRFKMEEYACETVVTDGKGSTKINPIFREIRETIKLTTTLLNDLSSNRKDVVPMDGDSDYYDSLFTAGNSKKAKRRKMKR